MKAEPQITDADRTISCEKSYDVPMKGASNVLVEAAKPGCVGWAHEEWLRGQALRQSYV